MIHLNAVSESLLKSLQQLSGINELATFRLVGGTALSLLIGHRKSIDIDLFSNNKISKQKIAKAIKDVFNEECFVTEDSISTRINNVKVDIFDDWMIPFRQPSILFNEIRIASLKDIAAFKLTAITERREKKDYIDLYFLFEELGAINVFNEYKSYNPNLSTKSILFALGEVTSAKDNTSPMPDMIKSFSWDAIVKAIENSASDYVKYLKINNRSGLL